MKLRIENKHKILGRIVKNDIIMILPEMIHKGETYQFKAIDDKNNYYRWELTRLQLDEMLSGPNKYQMYFSDGKYKSNLILDKEMVNDMDTFLYACASMMPY
jgi:hypothetical protein